MLLNTTQVLCLSDANVIFPTGGELTAFLKSLSQICGDTLRCGEGEREGMEWKRKGRNGL